MKREFDLGEILLEGVVLSAYAGLEDKAMVRFSHSDIIYLIKALDYLIKRTEIPMTDYIRDADTFQWVNRAQIDLKQMFQNWKETDVHEEMRHW